MNNHRLQILYDGISRKQNVQVNKTTNYKFNIFLILDVN